MKPRARRADYSLISQVPVSTSTAPNWISQRPNLIRASAIINRITRIALTLLVGIARLGLQTVVSSLKSAILSFNRVRAAPPLACRK